MLTQFWGKGGKDKTLTTISPKWAVRELEFFVQFEAFEYSKIKS